MAVYTYTASTEVNATRQELWDFLSNPANLDALTPKHMGGSPVGDMPDKMKTGMEVTYEIRLLRFIKLEWIARFPEVIPNAYFIDQQVKGPFKSWQHNHIIAERDGKIYMDDKVIYEPPLGVLGDLGNALIIRPMLKSLFRFRSKIFKKMFQ
jgi:ligand-binding SRPBCC domain-containing protein